MREHRVFCAGITAVILCAVLAGPVMATMSAPMNGRDLTGTNLNNGWIAFDGDSQDCADWCDSTSGCMGVVYVAPGLMQGPEAHCWMKSRVTGQMPADYLISFLKEQDSLLLSDTGGIEIIGRLPCMNGKTPCGDQCADLRTDEANCGACGVTCAKKMECSNGVCILRSAGFGGWFGDFVAFPDSLFAFVRPNAMQPGVSSDSVQTMQMYGGSDQPYDSMQTAEGDEESGDYIIITESEVQETGDGSEAGAAGSLVVITDISGATGNGEQPSSPESGNTGGEQAPAVILIQPLVAYPLQDNEEITGVEIHSQDKVPRGEEESGSTHFSPIVGYILQDNNDMIEVQAVSPNKIPASPTGPVAIIRVDPNPGYTLNLIYFDPSLSYHAEAPNRHILTYDWDLDNDGIFDQSSTIPKIISRGYTVAGEYRVALKVTDDAVPAQSDKTVVKVIIREGGGGSII